MSFLLDPTSSQNDVEWYRLQSPRFTVYADNRAEKIARYGLEALEDAYPAFSLLLGVHLENEPPLRPNEDENLKSAFERIPVIIGTTVDGGGFANPVTQNIELKIPGGSARSLFQHELTHRMMYEHLDLSIGPGGRVFTLAMTPTWWIEGLPELFTESVGRLQTAGVGRSMALHDAFPDWDRIHALYQLESYDEYLRGYVTSGLFFRYLASDERVGDLYELHRDWFWKTLTPPFITAEDLFFYAKFGMLGSTYYREFQKSLKETWRSQLEGVPALSDLERGPPLFVSEATPRIDELERGFILSDLFFSVYPSSIEFRPKKGTSSENKTSAPASKRIPFEGEGSSLSEVWESQDGQSVLWTMAPKRNREGRRRYELVRARLSARFEDVTRIEPEVIKTWDLEERLGDSLVSDFITLDGDRLLLITSTFGRNDLVVFDAREDSLKTVVSYDVPHQISFVAPIPGRQRSCVTLLVDGDNERTSLDRFCLSPEADSGWLKRPVLPAQQIALLSVAEHHEEGYLAIGGWGDLAGLFRISEGGVIDPLLPLKDWVLGLQPAYEPGTYYLWKHVGVGYSMREIRLETAEAQASAFRSRMSTRSDEQKVGAHVFGQWPGFEPFVPPFESYAQRVREGKRAIVREESRGFRRKGEDSSPRERPVAERPELEPAQAALSEASLSQPERETVTVEAGAAPGAPVSRGAAALSRASDARPGAEHKASQNQTTSSSGAPPWEKAAYTHDHWFTYPQARPSFFGGPSLGLVSVPFRDEMERYQVTVIGDYSFDTERTSLKASFASRRVFEELRLDLFSRERFNGLYYRFPCAVDEVRFRCVTSRPNRGGSGYFHYLRENGGTLSTTVAFRPSATLLGLGLSISDISHSIGVRFPELGPQFLTLMTLNSSLFFKLFEEGFYMGAEEKPGASMLLWRGVFELTADENLSLGGVQDGTGQSLANQKEVHFQNAGLGVATSLAYASNRLTLRGELGKTFGEDDLNRRQVFSPYRTYLLGSGSELNRLNVPILGSTELFGYVAGDWMYRMTLDYARPLLSNLNTRITVVFLESIDIEAVIGRGGVAYGEDFSDPVAIDSASAALRFNMDIKGFKIFPAVAVGKVLDSEEWSVFAEVSFSDFL